MWVFRPVFPLVVFTPPSLSLGGPGVNAGWRATDHSNIPEPASACHGLADLFYDTLPCNAHTTASDALWAGLPVVTCLGTTFAGRVAGGLLNAVGLPELITNTLEDYEALALKLAQDKGTLTALKSKLARNRLTHPLFDTDRYRRNLEKVYETMWARYQRGEKPSSLSVTAPNYR